MSKHSLIIQSTLLFLITAGAATAQNPAAPVIKAEEARIKANQQAQKQVDRTHDKTANLVNQYQNKLKVVDGLEVYNTLLSP